MFDEIKNEPEDVFAETDSAAPQTTSPTRSVLAQSTPPQTTPPQSVAQTTPVIEPSVQSISTSGMEDRVAQLQSKKKGFPIKAVLFFVAIVVVIVLAYFLSKRILNSRTSITPEAPQTTNEQNIPSPPTPTTPAIIQEEIPVPEESTVDSDKDGLLDSRETELGLNPTNPDTDADGLFDREEVDVYHTNPLNPDTDEDTFKDGDEVKKGYNPNGQGKLLEIPKTK